MLNGKSLLSIMSLGCDHLSILKPIPSFTILQSPHQIPIWTHHFHGIIPRCVHCGPYYPLPLSATFCATEIYLCPVSPDDQTCYLWVGMGPPLDNICTFYQWPCGQSISDFPFHSSPYLQAGVKRL